MWIATHNYISWNYEATWPIWHQTSWCNCFRFCQSLWQSPAQTTDIKIEILSISGPILYWITAFLTNQTQHILLDESSSDTVPVSWGVPQCTTLGPLLFLLYINDLPLSTPNSSTWLFVDNSLVFRAVETPDDCRLLQKDLDTLQWWECIWQMHLCTDKCKPLRFTRAHNLIHYTYTLHSSDLESATHTSILVSTSSLILCITHT